MSDNVIKVWLKFLNLQEYYVGFIDNGYDDMEMVKSIKQDDLEAIGVDNEEHKKRLLRAVKEVKEKGGAWVYLLYCDEIEESDITFSDESENYVAGSSGPESCKSSIPPSSDEIYSDESLNIGKHYSYMSGDRGVS